MIFLCIEKKIIFIFSFNIILCFQHLIKSHASSKKQMGSELGQIKNEFSKQIYELKNALMRNESMLKHQNDMFDSKSTTSLCSANSSQSKQFPAESIKSSIKLNENIYKMGSCCVDKFRKFVVDNDSIDDDDDEKDSDLMIGNEGSITSAAASAFNSTMMSKDI